MNTAEKIYQKARSLPEPAQAALLRLLDTLAQTGPEPGGQSLTIAEAAELRGKLAAWEADWNAPGMEAYDEP